MHRSTTLFHRLLAAVIGAALFGVSSAAQATDPPDSSVDIPTGFACGGFDLRLEQWVGKGDFKELKDNNGYTRLLFGGTASALRLTNLNTGKSISTKSNGVSQFIETSLTDGSTVYSTHGHMLLIWFPTDLPAGPFTILNSGNVVFTVTTAGVGSDLSIKGNTFDVCAALS